MKKADISKLEKVQKSLMDIAPKFGHQERMMWAIKNNLSLYTVNLYMKGKVGSLIIAEKLYADIVDHLKHKTLSPAA